MTSVFGPTGSDGGIGSCVYGQLVNVIHEIVGVLVKTDGTRSPDGVTWGQVQTPKPVWSCRLDSWTLMLQLLLNVSEKKFSSFSD